MDLETIFQGGFTPAKWRLLGDYLKGDKLHPGKGIRIDNSASSGKTVSAIKQREYRRSQQPPFSILTLQKVPASDPAEYKVTLQDGSVIERDTTSGSDGVVEHDCNIGGSPMSTRPRPELTLSDGEFIAVTFTTDADGFIQGTPAVVAASTEQDSIHHQPASGEGLGESGDYWIKISQLNIVSGAPEITVFQQSDIEHSRLWKGRNIGGARYIHKERDGANDTYDFRTLEQFEPVGRTYGKVIVPFVNGDEQDDANDSIKFSAIAGRASNPQVNVKDNGAGIITVEGNGNSGVLEWSNCEDPAVTVTLLQWEDGLIITNEDTKITAGCSGSGSGG